MLAAIMKTPLLNNAILATLAVKIAVVQVLRTAFLAPQELIS